MTFYYFSEKKRSGKDAGNKARNDVETILNDMGYKPLFPYNKSNSRINHVISIMKVLHQVRQEDYIVIQYPLPMGYNFLLKIINQIKNTVIIIHDLPELRAGRMNGKDARQLMNANYIISHNHKMDKYLLHWGIDSKRIIDLKIFDYLASWSPQKAHFEDNSLICFAGNLIKSNFIYKLSPTLKYCGVNVYGINFNKPQGKGLRYLGSYDSEMIYQKIKGKFGLVWDGSTTNRCSGPWGEYLRYNNPHKASMYLVAGMPIIIWNKAALSDLVQKEHLGIVVSSLEEIPSKINSLSREQYQYMVSNVNKFRLNLIYGNMLKNSLKEVKAHIGEKNAGKK